jgi:hypothetical protein
MAARRTEPNDAGRQYRHSTLSAYTAGKCRCEHCRGAYTPPTAPSGAPRGRTIRARLPGTPYSPSQMTYDLRRLRLNELIRCVEHTRTYVLTPQGRRIAVFYTKLYNRLLRPLAAADQPQTPPALRQALAVIDHHVDDRIARARLKPTA